MIIAKKMQYAMNEQSLGFFTQTVATSARLARGCVN